MVDGINLSHQLYVLTWSGSIVVSFWLQGLVVELIALDIPLSGSLFLNFLLEFLFLFLSGRLGFSVSVEASPLSVEGDVF